MWTSTELAQLGGEHELNLTTFNSDGTRSKPVIIWMVRVGDQVYVRSYRGRSSKWFQHLLQKPEGRISAGSVTREVRFEEVEDNIHPGLDAAYATKYQSYGRAIVDSVNCVQSQSATLKIVSI